MDKAKLEELLARVAKLEDIAHPPVDMAERISAGQIGQLIKQAVRIADALDRIAEGEGHE